jgi:hypothetical protein
VLVVSPASQAGFTAPLPTSLLESHAAWRRRFVHHYGSREGGLPAAVLDDYSDQLTQGLRQWFEHERCTTCTSYRTCHPLGKLLLIHMKRCSNHYCITFLEAQLANTALRKSDTMFKRSSALLQSGSDITFCNSFCSGVCWFCICCGGGGGGFHKSVLNIIGDGDDNHRSPNKSQFPPQPPPLLPAARAQLLVIRAAAALSKLLRAIAVTRKVQKEKQHTIIPRQIRPGHVCTRPRDENLRGRVGGGSGLHACCGSNFTHAEIVL